MSRLKDAWSGLLGSMADDSMYHRTYDATTGVPPGYWNITTTDNTGGLATSTITADDILIEGTSLGARLDHIEERLNILRPDLPLHEDWAELKDLYEKYNAKLEEIREKVKMWDKLTEENL